MNYEILIKSGILSDFANKIKANMCCEQIKTFAIVTDKNVSALYEKTVAESLINAGFNVISYAIAPGEKSKSGAQFLTLQNWLAENQVTRSDALIALGGGVVGDLTGFTAATYLRGVKFIQVPTTLLAMVDSSVGGKTAIDIPAGKNLVGAFYQPSVVICDPTVLSTLTPEIFSDGCAEVIKHGMICSEKLLNILKVSPIHENLEEIIAENVKIKWDIVQKDEFDTGERQLLNFGHTIGHAIEKLSKYEISHGKSVAIGMAMITRSSVKMGLCPPECLEVLESLLEKCGLPNRIDFSPEEIFNAALSDKKRMGDTLTEVIPTKIGLCELKKMPINELLERVKKGGFA
ncbi:MAG: 3-dehydroquinate synthase [Defluviitaleaceae bacterium]|nr:3-dehydroquinate synthase [Defluviitaleaceae bacterium]